MVSLAASAPPKPDKPIHLEAMDECMARIPRPVVVAVVAHANAALLRGMQLAEGSPRLAPVLKDREV